MSERSIFLELLDIADPGFSGYGLTETAFAVVGAIVSGLMGIAPDAPNQRVETLSRLADGTAWVRVTRLPLVRNEITVEHRGSAESVFINQSGPLLQWKAAFVVTHANARILVDGTSVPVTIEHRSGGSLVASAVVPAGAGRSLTAKLKDDG